MTKEEFVERLPRETRAPSDVEYEMIEFVYTYHPSISATDGKNQIAMLYSAFGMRIITDMIETAKRAQEIEDERFKLRGRLLELEREAEALSMI